MQAEVVRAASAGWRPLCPIARGGEQPRAEPSVSQHLFHPPPVLACLGVGLEQHLPTKRPLEAVVAHDLPEECVESVSPKKAKREGAAPVWIHNAISDVFHVAVPILDDQRRRYARACQPLAFSLLPVRTVNRLPKECRRCQHSGCFGRPKAGLEAGVERQDG